MLPRRVVGFMGLACQIVKQTPGLTAQEVYRRASDMAKHDNKRLSAAKSPQGSLVATLHKHYHAYGLQRKRVGREYQYYPAALPATTGGAAILATFDGRIALPPESEKQVEALVNLGRFSNKEEAQRELIAIGLKTLLAKLAR